MMNQFLPLFCYAGVRSNRAELSEQHYSHLCPESGTPQLSCQPIHILSVLNKYWKISQVDAYEYAQIMRWCPSYQNLATTKKMTQKYAFDAYSKLG